ncbi:MAG TPA: Clp protease, partial [Hyphomicrobiaceae bacterium]|nr:Clp protease [Hyphomicrobiaceae bacterium]
PRPPLPTGPGAGGRLTARLERIPGPGDRPGTPPAHPAAHPTGNGHLPGGFPAQAGHPRPPPPGGATRPGRPPQAAQAGQAGPIIESVPRRMRAGLASACEVRIARDRVDGLIAALNGPATRPDSYAVRALSVRLRAPNGGFVIESASPETQWIENTSSMIHDDHAVWRWTVTPRRAGNGRLVIMVSARTIGHDGVAADTAPPDRVIEVKVRGSALRGLGRAAGWLVVAALGAAAGRFGAQLWDAGAQAVKMVAGW